MIKALQLVVSAVLGAETAVAIGAVVAPLSDGWTEVILGIVAASWLAAVAWAAALAVVRRLDRLSDRIAELADAVRDDHARIIAGQVQTETRHIASMWRGWTN